MKSFLHLLFAIGTIFLFALQADARTQRMAIPSGTYTVGGGGSGKIPAFCMDSRRAAPSGTMPNLLGSGAQSTKVTRLSDDTTLSLAEALAEGWLTLNGTGSATGIEVIANGNSGYRIDVENSFAVSEEPGEPVGDINSTLSWLDTQDTTKFEGVGLVWEYRETTAISDLGGNEKFSYLFGGAENLLELQHRVHEAGPGTVALTHSGTGTDAYDRVAVTSDFQIQVFGGPDADRKLFKELEDIGGVSNIWLTNERNFEQFQVQPFQTYVLEKMRVEDKKFIEAELNSAEEQQALDKFYEYRANYVAAQRSAVEIGLALSAEPSDKELVIMSLPEAGSGGGGIKYRSGILESFDGGEPPRISGSDGGGGLPPPIRAALGGTGQPQRIGRVRQDNHVWTAVSRSLNAVAGIATKVDSTFKVALGALIGAVRQDQTRQEVVGSVERALELNRDAYEAYPTIGEVEVQLWFDSVEELKMRVAVIETNFGIRFAALNE